MATFEENVEKYADLAVKTAVNIQKNQTLLIYASIDSADFVRNVTEKAYQAGAKHVYVDWSDDVLTHMKYENESEEALKEFPEWLAKGREKLAEEGCALMSVYSPNPELLKDINPKKIATANNAKNQALDTFSGYQMSSQISWTILSVPNREWAMKVFPEKGADEAVEKLWDEIFKMTRVDQDNPVAAWEEHNRGLNQKVQYLNKKGYRKLHYRAEGTELSIELPEGHIWIGGGSENKKGNTYIANVPTEEVFSLPLKSGVNGTVRSTKPLNHSGKLIENFSITFKDGRIVDYNAESGYETLKEIVETDEGSHYLGEVALVPYNSPISQSGLIFYNTLFDENASCHLAIGRAYPCFEDGMSISKDEAESRGANHSLVHVDFMMGAADLDIDGETDEGKIEPVFRDGNWAI